MRQLIQLVLFAVILTTACMAFNASAAVLSTHDAIAVDFADDDGVPTNFNLFDSNTTIPAGSVVRYGDGATLDGVSVKFEGAVGFNNDSRANGWPGTAADPYYTDAANDLTYALNTGLPLNLTFAGLDDSRDYNVRIYALFNGDAANQARTETFSVSDGAGTASVTLDRATRWDAATLEAGGTVFSGVSTDGSGNIEVSVAGAGYDNPFINAVVLEANPVPEPAALAVWLGLVLAGVFGLRSRGKR